MIMIKIEMWPKGLKDHAYTLAEVRIINDGTGDLTRGNYYAELSKKGGFSKGIWKRALVKEFPRKSHGALDLLYRVLKYALKGRNP